MNVSPHRFLRNRKRLRRLLGTGLLGYAIVLVALALLEPRLVYPGAYWTGNSAPPEPFDSSVQTVEYASASGARLHGRLLETPGARGALLYLHGNGTRALWLNPRLERFARAFQRHVMVAEFRGFDGSGFTPSEASVVEDALAARAYLCGRYGLQPDQILLYGRSLGGGVAAALASRGGAQALILERTFERLVDVAAEHYPWAPVRWIMHNRWDSMGRLKDFEGPVIQLHGTSDRIVPLDHGRRLFDSLTTTQKAWIEVEGLGHNDGLSDPDLARVVEALERFELERVQRN